MNVRIDAHISDKTNLSARQLRTLIREVWRDVRGNVIVTKQMRDILGRFELALDTIEDDGEIAEAIESTRAKLTALIDAVDELEAYMS